MPRYQESSHWHPQDFPQTSAESAQCIHHIGNVLTFLDVWLQALIHHLDPYIQLDANYEFTQRAWSSWFRSTRFSMLNKMKNLQPKLEVCSVRVTYLPEQSPGGLSAYMSLTSVFGMAASLSAAGGGYSDGAAWAAVEKIK